MKSWKSYEGFEEKLPNHVFVQRVASAAGVSNQSVHRVAKKRLEKEGKRDRKRLEGCPYTFVSLDLWDTYMQIGSVSRVPNKPKGWVTAKSLLEDGFSKRKLYQFVKEGEIEAVYVGNTLYLDPSSARAYLYSRQNLRPPPGWVAVSELKTLAKRSKQAIFTYLKRHDIATKQFLHPKRDQLVQYLSQEDAVAYLESICQTNQEGSSQGEQRATVEQPANSFEGSGYTTLVTQRQDQLEKNEVLEFRHQAFMLPSYSDSHPGFLGSGSGEQPQHYKEASW
jgi:hypothetical protein